MWWRELIDQNFPDLTQDHKEGLLLRWAYGDKKTLNLRSLDKTLGKEKASLIKKFDKEDVKKKYKENIRPFEDLFLELGSVILKNASNFVAANPEKVGGIESIIPTEGVVFVYNGKVFKLTGTFAAINQLMGIIKYGR